MSEVYNLQVKISKETEYKLRELAKADKRKLSSYVRVVLEELTEGVKITTPTQVVGEQTTNTGVDIQNSNVPEQTTDNVEVEGAFGVL